MTQWVGARRPHMAMGTTSPDAVDISAEEALSDYTTAVKDTNTIIILPEAAEAETERSSHDCSLCRAWWSEANQRPFH